MKTLDPLTSYESKKNVFLSTKTYNFCCVEYNFTLHSQKAAKSLLTIKTQQRSQHLLNRRRAYSIRINKRSHKYSHMRDHFPSWFSYVSHHHEEHTYKHRLVMYRTFIWDEQFSRSPARFFFIFFLRMSNATLFKRLHLWSTHQVYGTETRWHFYL